MKEDCGLRFVRLVGRVGKKVAHPHGRRWVSWNGTLSWPKHSGPRDVKHRSWRSWFRVGKRSRGELSQTQGHAAQLEQHSEAGVSSISCAAAAPKLFRLSSGDAQRVCCLWWRCPECGPGLLGCLRAHCVTIDKAGCMFVVIHTTLKITVGCEAQRTCRTFLFQALARRTYTLSLTPWSACQRASKAEAKELKNSNDPAHQ